MCGKRCVRAWKFDFFCFLLLGILIVPFASGPAFAIPSPELIVGSFVSLSQIFAVASAILGGGAAYATMRSRAGSGSGNLSRGLFFAAFGMFVLLCASVGANIWQYSDRKAERQAQLEETILRPSRTPGSLPIDPEVKELTYGQQTRHPDAITTAEAEEMLKAAARGERTDLLFLDVRERAEREMGTLKGVTFVRYPDIAKSGIDFTGKKAVLFCHNGNRSHETCEALKKQGIDCGFIVGGVEKWVTEGREMEGLEARTVDQLRAIPDYPNRDTLLDTAQVRDLVAKEKAIFVDVRYPFEFKTHGTLPDAINLAVRRIPTDQLPDAMAQVPKRPIILPCYDRRGCFFAEVLGLELSRAGHDVRGRYTQPWLYFVKGARPPHVEAWIAENNKSLWVKASEYLAGRLEALAQWTGLIGAIFLLALASRILVLPFSLKAERDQLRSRLVADKLEALKENLRNDPARRARAIRAFYKENGFTPGRNLLALLFLPVMALALLAVQELAVKSAGGLLWIQHLAVRDPYFVLPLIFGVLITLYVDLVFAKSAKTRAVIWLVMLPLMVATGTLFGAAANMYLVASAVFLLLQRLWVSGWFARRLLALRNRSLPAGAISLEDVSRVSEFGNKAARLAQMRAAGMPVPDGILLSPVFLKNFADASAGARKGMLDRIWNRLGAVPLAVRSSATGEDGADQSFAGVFSSKINIEREGLEKAVVDVMRSFDAARAKSYGQNGGEGSVLLQRMVDATYSGVLFTRDPSAGALTMVELVEGTAHNLVSGSVRPQAFRIGRLTGNLFGKNAAPIDLKPLLALGEQAERLFGAAQDIEWTWRDGNFYLVQSRDITRSAGEQDGYAIAAELAKDAAPGEVVFAKNEMSEMLPRPTRLSFSLLQSMWASGGSIDLAARELGLHYNVQEGSEYLVSIGGRLYVNKREEKARNITIGRLAARRLRKSADRVERDIREMALPRILADARLGTVADFDKLSNLELVSEVALLRDRFIQVTHVDVDIVNISAGFHLDRARRALELAGIDASGVLGHIPRTYEGHAIEEINAAPSKARRWKLVHHFGHRAALDYELAEPRYAEDMNSLERMFESRLNISNEQDNMPSLGKKLDLLVDVARRFQTLKEDAKHHSLREFAVLRRAVLSLGRRFGLEDNVFHLDFEELLALDEQNAASMQALAARRHAQAEAARMQPSLPSRLTAADLENASAGISVGSSAVAGDVRGTRVAGGKLIEGRARIVREEDAELGKPITGFQSGDIIVAQMVSSNWLPYFATAGGFVAEVGGWLSHPAILAREYDVAMIVGTEGIARIKDGAWLRLHLDGSVEVLPGKPAAGQVAAA